MARAASDALPEAHDLQHELAGALRDANDASSGELVQPARHMSRIDVTPTAACRIARARNDQRRGVREAIVVGDLQEAEKQRLGLV